MKTRIQSYSNQSKAGTTLTVGGFYNRDRNWVSVRPNDIWCENPYDETTHDGVEGRRFKILKVEGGYWEIEHLPREGEEPTVAELPFKVSKLEGDTVYITLCNAHQCTFSRNGETTCTELAERVWNKTRFCSSHHIQAFGDGPDPHYGKPNPYLTSESVKHREEPKPMAKRLEMMKYSQYPVGACLKVKRLGISETVYFEPYSGQDYPYANTYHATKLSDFVVGEVYRVDELTSNSMWLELVLPAPIVDVNKIIESSKCQSVEPSEKSLTREHGAETLKESGMKLYTGGVVTRTSTVQAGDGVTTGKEIKEVVHQVSVAFYAPNDETARALVLMDAVEAKKITKDDLASAIAPLTVSLSCPNCVN